VPDANRSLDILQYVRTTVSPAKLKLARHVFMYPVGNGYAAGIRQGLQARCDIDAITKDASLVVDDVALRDTNPKAQSPGGWVSVLLPRSLNGYSACDCGRSTLELRQDAISSGIDQTSALLRDNRLNRVVELSQCASSPFFVLAHMAAEAFYISRKNGSQSTVHDRGSS
jgi:hypothetical protein